MPINITDKLLIKGRDVEQSINNVGALSAALTGLPTVPEDSPLSCGVGTGTHGGNYALSGGCASRINDRLTLNGAASIIPNDQEYQGDTQDRWSGRVGFVFKLGKINKPAMISAKEKKEFQAKVKDLEFSNIDLNAKVDSLEVTNQGLQDLVAMQNERLEKLERIALGTSDENKKYDSFFNLSSLFLSVKSFLISSK